LKTLFIHHNESKLAIVKFGNGVKVMICFHGYGLDKNSFLQFEEKYGKEYTMYSFDSFAHGKSQYGNGENALELEEWKNYLLNFLDQEKIEKFSILSFSMGGKIALCTLELFYSRVEKMILIAPDGIKTNFWYNATTYPGILNKAFRYTVFYPSIYFNMIEILKFLRLSDKSLLKFSEFEMNTATKRVKVYFAWMIYRNFRPNLEHIIQFSTERKIGFEFYTGKYDRIIQTKHIDAFVNRLTFVKHIEFECGHTNLMKQVSQISNSTINKLCQKYF